MTETTGHVVNIEQQQPLDALQWGDDPISRPYTRCSAALVHNIKYSMHHCILGSETILLFKYCAFKLSLEKKLIFGPCCEERERDVTRMIDESEGGMRSGCHAD